MKKYTHGLICSLVLILAPLTVAKAANPHCDAKRSAIEEQIQYAKQHNNAHQVAGLEEALRKVNINCTDESLRQDADKDVRHLERKLREKQSDMRELQIKLSTEQSKADANKNKVAKYEKKLLRKQQDEQEVQQELKTARDKVASLKP